MSRLSPANTAFLIFVAGCLLSTLRMVHGAPSALNIRPDNIQDRSDKRFATLRAELPSRGIVGYVGDSDDSALPDYYLTQYALAPLVVDRGAQHPLVIGNFPHSQTTPAIAGLALLKDFGNGVFLFGNKDAR